MKGVFINPDEKRLRAGWRILLFIIMVVAFIILLSVTVLTHVPGAYRSFSTNVLVAIVMLVSVYFTHRFIDKRPVQYLKISVDLSALIKGVSLGIGLMSVIFIIQFLLGWVAITDKMFARFDGYTFGLLMVLQVIRYLTGSLFEEAFSRGYLFRNLAEGFSSQGKYAHGAITAFFFSSLLFGSLHAFNPNSTVLSTINLMLIGLMFGLPVLATGKLTYSIGLHAAWNMVQNNVFGTANSGKKPEASIWITSNTGPDLLSGGTFGPEGGFICTVLVSLTILSMAYLFRHELTLQQIAQRWKYDAKNS